jgi:hypothetical protein
VLARKVTTPTSVATATSKAVIRFMILPPSKMRSYDKTQGVLSGTAISNDIVSICGVS